MGKTKAMDTQSHSGRPKAHRKLKESCNECGHAKVKCSKEKPACSRCRERGLICGYDFSSRAGRRLASRSSTSDPSSTAHLSNTPPHQQQQQPHHFREHCLTASPSLSPALLSHNPTLIPSAANDADMAAFGYFSDAFSFNDYSLDYMTPSVSPTMPCNLSMPAFDLPPPSAMNFKNLNLETQQFLGSAGVFENNHSTHMNPVFTPPSMMSPDVMSHPSPERARTPPRSSCRKDSSPPAVCHEVLRGNNSCLSKVLDVLVIQERGSFADGSSAYGSGASTPISSMASVEDAIHINRTILDAAASTLDCHCLCTNNQLIYLLVSTAFDVMARYAKAAAEPFEPQQSLQQYAVTNASSTSNHNFSPARLVFGELHKVLRFIDLLAQRFQEITAMQRPGGLQRNDSFISGASNVPMSSIGNVSSSYAAPGESWKGSSAVCVSDSTFRALEADLRRRLKDIRDGILAQLRSM